METQVIFGLLVDNPFSVYYILVIMGSYIFRVK